jgi:hypothetical protein
MGFACYFLPDYSSIVTSFRLIYSQPLQKEPLVPHTPALRMSQANSLTMALTAQILRARGLLPLAEEPLEPPAVTAQTLIAHGLLAAAMEAPAPDAAARAATRARARELREELMRLGEEARALLRETRALIDQR